MRIWKKKQKAQAPIEQKEVSFRRLVYEAMPEMWSFQILLTTLLVIPVTVLKLLMASVAEAEGVAITTANYQSALLSWRSPLLLLLGALLVASYIVLDLFAKVFLCGDILGGHSAGVWGEIKKSVLSLRRFLTPTGAFALLYVVIIVPLCGVGFSISLTKTLYIPNFIMDVIRSKPLYLLAYLALIFLFIWIGYRYAFTLHAVLLDKMTPAEGIRTSARIIKKHGKSFALTVVRTFLILTLIQVAVYLLFRTLPALWIEQATADLPRGFVLEWQESIGREKILETMRSGSEIIVYRIFTSFVVLMGGYLFAVTTLLCNAYFMLRFTRCYLEYTREEPMTWLERPKKARYYRKAFRMILVFLLVALLSVLIGLCYNQIFVREEPARLIAHRAGGTLASENSIEGLYAAIEHGCYASEIDVQRTKDGYYVINHDDDFLRLTGVARAPKDMTLDEIRELRIQDTTGSGAELPVVTLEEMLDVIKGREKLFIELKGVTADRRMVDDVVGIVREKNCVGDVVLISLNYDVIDYAESTYPEFETGTLFFNGIGNEATLNCDLLIMEEEIARNSSVQAIHEAGKQVLVWTVNTEDSMSRFLDSRVDGIITDEIELAQRVQSELDARSEIQVLQSKLEDFWE